MCNYMRSIFIDLLRVILCIGVVVFHYTYGNCCSGQFMVVGFFVLGGFLLGSSFEKMSDFNVNCYYSKKIKRLIPLYVIVLLLGVISIYAKKFLLPSEYSFFPTFLPIEWENLNLAKLVQHYNATFWFMIPYFVFIIGGPFLWFCYKSGRSSGIHLLLLAFFGVALLMYCKINNGNILGGGCKGLYYSSLYRMWQLIAGLSLAKIVFSRKICKFIKSTVNSKIVICFFLFFAIVAYYSMVTPESLFLGLASRTLVGDVLSVVFFSLLIPVFYFGNVKLPVSLVKLVSCSAALTYPLYLIHDIVFNFRRIPVILFDIILSEKLVCVLSFIVSIIVSIILLRIENKLFCVKNKNV